jgi:hypothetical protein
VTKTRDVLPPQRGDGDTTTGTRVLHPSDVTLVSRPQREKRGRVLDPVVFARTSNTMWELYVCVYREGEFRRIAMPLTQAREFLTDQLNRVLAAAATAAKMEENR